MKRDTPKKIYVEGVGKYRHKEYPKCLYHEKAHPKTVDVMSRSEHDEMILKGWVESPSDFKKLAKIEKEVESPADVNKLAKVEKESETKIIESGVKHSDKNTEVQSTRSRKKKKKH